MAHWVKPGGNEFVGADDFLFVIASASEAIWYESLDCLAASRWQNESRLPYETTGRLHVCNDVTADFFDAVDAGERHADVEFIADDLDRACHSGLPAGAQPVDVGAAA